MDKISKIDPKKPSQKNFRDSKIGRLYFWKNRFLDFWNFGRFAPKSEKFHNAIFRYACTRALRVHSVDGLRPLLTGAQAALKDYHDVNGEKDAI